MIASSKQRDAKPYVHPGVHELCNEGDLGGTETIHGEPYKSMTMMGIRDRPPAMWRNVSKLKTKAPKYTRLRIIAAMTHDYSRLIRDNVYEIRTNYWENNKTGI